MKTALFLASVVLLIIACEASPAPECSWGPSYWCQSKVTAKQCGQETYCNNEVWKATINTDAKVGSVQCDVCKLVIGKVQEMIGSNATEEDVENALKEVCSILGSLKDECDTLLTTLFPQIWQMIVNEVDPTTICSEIKLCTSLMAKAAKVEFKLGTVQCDACKLIIGLVKKAADAKSTEQEAEDALKEACSILGSLKDECNTLLTTFFPQIWQMIVNEVDPTTICTEIKLCTSVKAKAAKAEFKVGTVECDVCKLVIGEVQKIVKSNSTEQDVEDALKKVCDVSGSHKETCDVLLTTFFPQIWQMIVDEVDPETICSLAKLCSSSTMVETQVAKVGTVQCDICKIVAQYLQQFVNQNKTEDEVEKELENFCGLLGSLKGECDTLLSDYFPKLWDLIVKEMDPSAVCSDLGLCSTKEIAEPLALFKVKLKLGGGCTICTKVVEALEKLVLSHTVEDVALDEVKKVCIYLGPLDHECKDVIDKYFPQMWQLLQQELSPGDVCDELKLCSNKEKAVAASQSIPQVKSIECDYCKIIAMYLNKFIASNATETEAKQEVKNLCSMMGSESSECTTVVDLFFDEIWKMLEEETEPDVICNLLKLCTNKSVKTFAPGASLNCDICQLVSVLILRPTMDSKDSEHSVRDFLKATLCISFISPQTVNKCMNFFDTYFPYLWTKIEDQVDAGLACKDIGVCKSKATPPQSPKHKVALPKQSLCDLCEILVNFLQPFVDSNSTEKEVENAIEQLCSILPSSLKSQCTGFVDANFDDIWTLLKSELDNDLICKQIGVCNSSSTMTVVKKPAPRSKVTLPKQSVCDICKLVVTFLAPYVDSNTTENEVKQAVESLCNILPSGLKDECTSLVDQYFDTIWKLVESEVNDSLICKQIGLCNSTMSFVKLPVTPRPKIAMPRQTACDVCKIIVTFIKPCVDSNATQEKVKELLDEVCNVLPANYSSQCNTLLTAFFPTIWDMVEKEFDDGEICNQLNICNNASFTTKSLSAPKHRVLSAPDPVCDVCKLLASLLKPFADNQTAENETIAALKKVCSLAPTDYSKICHDFTDKYARDAWDVFRKEIDGGTFCSDEGFCQSQQTKDPEVLMSTAFDHPVSVGDNTLCIACKTVSAFVRNLVENNATKEEAEKAVTDFCTKVPSPYNSSCLTLVTTYFDMIWMLIDSYVEDDDLCNKLKICNSSAATLELKKEASGPLCVICEFVMKELDSMLDSNTTQAEIKAALNKVCSILPKTIQTECDDFVSSYGDDIIKLLLEAVSSPKVVCATLSLCSATKLVVMPVVEEASLKDECSICKVVLGFVKTLVEDYQKPVEEALEDVCGLMPTTIKSECATFVKEYGPAVIQVLGQELDPEQICKDLKLCAGSSLMAPWKKLARAKSI